jgi:hypothetical protein
MPAAFPTPAPFTVVNSARKMLRGDRTIDVDLSLLKHIPLGESRYFQFRAEFQLHQHTSFANPSANISHRQRLTTFAARPSTHVRSNSVPKLFSERNCTWRGDP